MYRSINIKSLTLTISILFLSSSVNADVITYGSLSTDNTTDYITDTTTGREYKRFDAFDFTYEQTLAAVAPGGVYDGWNIATSDTAEDFYNAILNSTSTSCSGENAFGTVCGQIAGWVDDSFGKSGTSVLIPDALYDDYFWYLSTNDTPDRPEEEIGYGFIDGIGATILDYDDWTSGIETDVYNVENGVLFNALLYRDVSAVPIPAAVWLFGSGLLGLVGVARRKKA